MESRVAFTFCSEWNHESPTPTHSQRERDRERQRDGERETERGRERRYYDHDTIWQLEVSPDDTIDKQMIFPGHKISIADQILFIERQAAESAD
jgi:hypothetical protein